ncbi:hypothetical protein BJ508DRAFT_196256, partial [Ascobolus immersus RN42]
MKHIASSEVTFKSLQSWAGSSKLLYARHFFWISTTDKLQKSLSGLYRSLLFQIFQAEPRLILLACPRASVDSLGRKYYQNHAATDAGTTEGLKSILHRVSELVASSTPIDAKLALFIDGLDEYDTSEGGDPSDIAMVVKRLARWKNVKLCVSSRPWSVFSNEFGDGNFQVAIHQFTFDDMKRYASDLLNELSFFRKARQSDTRWTLLPHDIAEKAEGVWLWTSLVSKILVRKVAAGENYSTANAILEKIPQDLDEYFKELVGRSNEQYKGEGARILLLAL